METTIDWRRIEVVDEDVAAVLRRMPPEQKHLRASNTFHYYKLRLAGFFKTEHPDWSEEQIRQAVLAKVIDGTNRTDPVRRGAS